MKITLTLFFLACITVSLAQKKVPVFEKEVYYFFSKDSLGVKDKVGNIIISPRYYFTDHENYDTLSPILQPVIYLESSPDGQREPNSFGAIYDRNGRFLFCPFAYDNGPDNYSEGLRRFVKNGKIGFANRNGETVIVAKFDYAGSFRYGISNYCSGCKMRWEKEQRLIEGGSWGYIDLRGNELSVTSQPTTGYDQHIDSGKYIAYQFNYSPKEEKMLEPFYHEPLIAKALMVNYYGNYDSAELKLRYEIIERPSAFFPWYHVTAYKYDEKDGYYPADDDLNFYIDPVSREVFHITYFGEMTPYKKWFAGFVKSARKFSREHKDAPNRFKD